MTKSALQITNFNFYGDELLAIQDNATGEIYTAINSVLRGIGFTDRNQIRKRRDKWINDAVISKGICVFNIPTQELVSKNGTTLFDEKETHCISNRKLPLALAKINITPKMKKTQPELATKLELYQDKCADVLASVFIDHKTANQIILEPLLDNLTTFVKTVSNTLLQMNESITDLTNRLSVLEENKSTYESQLQQLPPKRKYSYWTTKMFPKYQSLMDYFELSSNKELYKQLYIEFENLYPGIEINQIVDDYCYENHLSSCFTLDAIEHDKTTRQLFEDMVNNLMLKYNLMPEERNYRRNSIFDD